MPGRMFDEALARTFDRTAEIYERARPGWPPEALNHATRDLRLGRSATVLDLGAGTGKLTRLLAERFDDVVAVEPLDGMRRLLESLVPTARALPGRAEQIPLAEASLDAVFCADAFHWFDGEAALTEIARVLRPGCGLVIVFNLVARPTEPSVASAADLLDRRGHAHRQVRRVFSGEWRAAFAGSPFEPLQEASFEHTQTTDREGLLAYWASMSWIEALEESERDQLLAEVRGVVADETYTRFWRTEMFWARLTAS